MRFLWSLLSFLILSSVALADEVRTYISYDENGFFNYNRTVGDVFFYETRYWRDSNGNVRGDSVAYRVDLNERKVISTYRYGMDDRSCFGVRVKRSVDGGVIVSYDPTAKGLKILNLETDDCQDLAGKNFLRDSHWSIGGKHFNVKDRYDRMFRVIDPVSLEITEYADGGNMPHMVVWSNELNRELYVFIPNKIKDVVPNNRTSNDYRYFYIDGDGNWRQYNDETPLMNSDMDYYFRVRSDIEVAPWTEFIHVESGETISTPESFYLSGHRSHAVWLDGGWVYFQGAAGIFNYLNGEFVTFGGDANNPVIPFSVDGGRYAIMYHQHEDRLKVYDLEKREYIESYEPFWRNKEDTHL